MPVKQFFLSCVSAEFKSYRETLRHDLDRPDVTVKIQEDFAAFGSETLCKLDAYIQHCEAVVHLVGDMTGAFAGRGAVEALLRTHPDLPERLPPVREFLALPEAVLPYTQWEAWLTLYHGKALLIACPTAQAPRDEGAVDELAQRALQRAHLERLAMMHRHPEIRFANADRLAVEVLRSPAGPGVSRATQRIHELPQRNPNFSGREDWLEQVRSTLGGDKPVVVAQAIVGLGGIGKTQLALEYAHRQSQTYNLIWWVRAESVALRDEDLLTLHRRMGLPAREGESTPERLATLRRALEATSRWLLVFDNVEQSDILQDIVPRVGGGHVLITSRLRDWQALAREVQLPVWSPAEALQYLAQRTGLHADATLQAIAEDLGYLPLALEQAAAYMVQAGVSAARYSSLLRRARLEPLDVQGASAIATIWDVSIRAVRARSPGALALLEFLSFMPPDDISRSALLGRGNIPMPTRLVGVLRDELSLNNAVSVLRGFSLIDAAQDRLQIHRLVQLVVSHRLSARDYRAYAETARRFQPGWVLETTPGLRKPLRWRQQTTTVRFMAVAIAATVAVAGIGLVQRWRPAKPAEALPQEAEALPQEAAAKGPATASSTKDAGSKPEAVPQEDELSYTDSIAVLAESRLIGTRAAVQLKKLLAGVSLKATMNWAQCANSVKVSGGEAIYQNPGQFKKCVPFESQASMNLLANFVKRNPTFKTYQFTSIAIQRDAYSPGYRGARKDDIVAALGAAIAVLQGRASPDPFSLKDPGEALRLLVSLVANLHRPLSVGTIYLDNEGQFVDPDADVFDPSSETAGANRLRLNLDAAQSERNLHALWNGGRVRTSSISTLSHAWRFVPRTVGPIEEWPTLWASETLLVARSAFEGLTVGPREGGYWPVALQAGYLDRMEDIKQQQIARAGRRLAQLLEALWP